MGIYILLLQRRSSVEFFVIVTTQRGWTRLAWLVYLWYHSRAEVG